MALKLPRLTIINVTDGKGGASSTLIRFWDQAMTAIEDAIARILVAETDIGDATAQGLFSVTQGTTSAGALATILLQVRATVGGVLKAASIKISALAVGSRIEITADDIWLNGNVLSSGAITNPMIGASAVGTTQIAGTAVTTAKIASAAVTGTEIASSAVDTTHIVAAAATLAGNTTDASATAAAAATAWTFLTSRTVTFTGNAVEIDVACDVKANNSNHLYGFAITIDSTNPEDGFALYNSNPGAGPVFDIAASGTWRSWSRHLDVTPSAASHTLRMYGMSDSTAIDFLNKAIRTAEIKR